MVNSAVCSLLNVTILYLKLNYFVTFSISPGLVVMIFYLQIIVKSNLLRNNKSKHETSNMWYYTLDYVHFFALQTEFIVKYYFRLLTPVP